MLQPFSNFEGWPEGSSEREDAWSRARGWRDIMSAVGTDMLQVGSTDAEGVTGDKDIIVADLRKLGEFLAERSMRLAYENWCWATYAPDWADVWDIVKRVDRGNVGLCLDTFQTAGGEWGDPRTESGKLDDVSEEQLEHRYQTSLKRLAETVPKEKIFLLQISDAYRPPKPLIGKDESGLRPRGRWSHDFRPIPFDGGYLPVVPMARAVLQTGFNGWFSMEVFDGDKDGKGRDLQALGGLEGYAKRAMASHKRLLKEAADP
jgi:sugar phosphate isomerase/epimerase